MKKNKSVANKLNAPTTVGSGDWLGVIWKSFHRRERTHHATENALWLAQLRYPTFSALLGAVEHDQQRLNYWEEMCNHRLQEMLALWRLQGRPEIKWTVSPEPDVPSCSFLSLWLIRLNSYFCSGSMTPNEKS
jgi:hypothetical protein